MVSVGPNTRIGDDVARVLPVASPTHFSEEALLSATGSLVVGLLNSSRGLSSLARTITPAPRSHAPKPIHAFVSPEQQPPFSPRGGL
jgi:hypothetical protein